MFLHNLHTLFGAHKQQAADPLPRVDKGREEISGGSDGDIVAEVARVTGIELEVEG